MNKKILPILLSCFLTATALFNTHNIYAEGENGVVPIKQPIATSDGQPQIEARFAFVIDYKTGRTLFEKNADQKLYPASTTKMWTAYNVLQNVKDLNKVVEIKDLPPIDGSSMYLENGESFTVKQLLQALLIHSSNDAAFVLGRYVGGGDINKFIDIMNNEAKAVGATATHFNNPHGLPDENHYTTAHDMGLMARQAMTNDVFREIVKTPNIKFDADAVYPYERYFKNTNPLLTSDKTFNYRGAVTPIKYDIVDGIKTGFTDLAGKCLLTSASKDDRRVIAAVFSSTNDGVAMDSRTLLDYGFDNYKNEAVMKSDDYVKSKNISFTKQKTLQYKPESDYNVLLKNGEQPKKYTVSTKLSSLNLPVKKGDVVGKAVIKTENEPNTEIKLVAMSDISYIVNVSTYEIKYVAVAAGCAIVLIGAIVIIVKRRRRRA
ncbi:MAG: D-alanyl-D-alanine carboxypeptidase [Clostridioides sp.]|jgi:D-alanyl-D-alanine carboxypeptidase (penicillin-binding protein 5/6)|nr:D-alanyl-D-alanine carboxypeptidase [Clostridioides sp.]